MDDAHAVALRTPTDSSCAMTLWFLLSSANSIIMLLQQFTKAELTKCTFKDIYYLHLKLGDASEPLTRIHASAAKRNGKTHRESNRESASLVRQTQLSITPLSGNVKVL